MEINETIKNALLSSGAALTGFAGLEEIPPAARHDLRYAVSIGLALNPAIVAQIINGPNLDYYAEYKRANQALLELAEQAAEIIIGAGHKAVYSAPTDLGIDPETHSTILPHKTSATRAGLGWIGKCALLVTREYGSAIRLITVLTDASLDTGRPMDESHCGECDACVKACPGQAPSGKEWRKGLYRDSFFNVYDCQKAARAKAAKQGIDETICGICIAVCPWTQKYIGLASEA